MYLYERQVKIGKIKNPGTGSGGNQYGEDNHQWKGGLSRRYRGDYRRTCYKLWPRECAICEGLDEVEVHHIDGDVYNDSIENLVPLCCEHHATIHTKRHRSKKAYEAALFNIWPNGRLKIAEKIGNLRNSRTIRPEGKA